MKVITNINMSYRSFSWDSSLRMVHDDVYFYVMALVIRDLANLNYLLVELLPCAYTAIGCNFLVLQVKW